MDRPTFWEEASPSSQHVKFESSSTEGSTHACKEEQSIFHLCDGNLNFATVATSEDDDFTFYKKKVSRDPMSHRIIEKRRRDRMNNCLADLSRLIPADYMKKGRGRIEKTEIIEMAIKHMKHLQTHACRQQDSCELTPQQGLEEPLEQHPIVLEHYRLGYQECLSETMHFMVEVEGFFAGDPICVQLINHLQKHCDKILKGDGLNFPRTHVGETTSTSSGSTGSGGYSSTIPLDSSGLGSSSCSDSSRTEKHGSPVASNEENYCEEGSMNHLEQSQLREMLTSSNLNALATNQAGINTSASVVNSQHSFASFSHQDFQYPASPAVNSGCAASLYKFKNNIKQRFSAEHHVDDDRRQEKFAVVRDVSSNLHYGAKRRRYGNEANNNRSSSGNTLLKRRDSETCSVPSPPASPSPDMSRVSPPPQCPQKAIPTPAYGIPIFALHSKGSFYIPLTLDADVLTPHLAAFGFGPDGSLENVPSSSVVLHPVTISVNFQQTSHYRTNLTKYLHNSQCSQMLPWKNESNNLMSLSKWSVCATDRD